MQGERLRGQWMSRRTVPPGVPVTQRPGGRRSSGGAGAPCVRPYPGVRPRRRNPMSAREVRAPRGRELSCRSWPQEAAMRMLMNNLDPDVAERPGDLVVYGGTGRAARSWEAFDAIVRTLRTL